MFTPLIVGSSGIAGELRYPVGVRMSTEIEAAARRDLVAVLSSDLSADDIDPSRDMSADYGLTSLNKVLFMMSVCTDTGVDLAAFTEADLAAMHTLADVIAALTEHVRQEA
jgi:acyl carrier protein